MSPVYKFNDIMEAPTFNDLTNSRAPLMAKLLLLLEILAISVGIVVLMAYLKRKWLKNFLQERCKLPTVLWRPRFFNYSYAKDNVGKDQKLGLPQQQKLHQKLPSSNITNILPRMARLDGPYGVYGTVYGISTPVVHIAHPIPAALVLKATKTKNPGYNHFKNCFGEGVFTADGDDWKRKRASVIHCLLSKAVLGDRIEIEANRAATVFLEKISIASGIGKTNSVSTKSVNIVPFLQSETVRIIYRYLTHESPEKHMETKIIQYSRENKVRDVLNQYLSAVIHIRMIILAQSRSFWFLLPRSFYRAFSPMYVEEEQTMGPIRKFATQACCNAKPGSPLDLLKERKSHEGKKSKTSNLISQNILDEAITLLFAGQDTSAATLSWTLHLLSLHPTIQHKLAIEIQTYVNSQKEMKYYPNIEELIFTKKMTSQMPYLNAVVKESMRLYPVAPFVVRKLNEDIHLPTKDAILPKDAFACIWIYGLHRNPLMWWNPHKFYPERWLENESSSEDVGISNASSCRKIDRGIMEGAFMPFAIGPRNCLGQSIGIVVVRIMLAKIIAKYEIVDEKYEQSLINLKGVKNNQIDEEKIANSMRRDMQAGFTVLPSGGVPLSLRQRKS